jgi:hypothetical protein
MVYHREVLRGRHQQFMLLMQKNAKMFKFFNFDKGMYYMFLTKNESVQTLQHS